MQYLASFKTASLVLFFLFGSKIISLIATCLCNNKRITARECPVMGKEGIIIIAESRTKMVGIPYYSFLRGGIFVSAGLSN